MTIGYLRFMDSLACSPLTITVGEFITLGVNYLEVKRHSLRPATHRNYSSLLSVLAGNENFLVDRLEVIRARSAPSSYRQRVQICNIILKYYGKPLLEVPKNRKVRRRVPQVLPRVKEMAREGHTAAQIFLLAYSIGGPRYTDLVSLTKANIVNGYISYQQSKTGYNVALPLNQQALWCIHVLRGGEYLVPRSYMRNWKINERLKDIHPLLQLHDSRRLMAAELHKQGVPLATIQAVGGWTSVETAMLYCGSLSDSQLQDAMGRLADG